MNNKRNLKISLTLNIIIVIMEIIGLIMSIVQMQWGMFQFYTQDSNLVAMAACAVLALYQIAILRGKKKKIPSWVTAFKYVAVCLVSVTFLVVIFVLAPLNGNGIESYKLMLLKGTMLYHHFLCPILAFVSFLFFENDNMIMRKYTKIAVLPTIIYAVTAVILNVMHVMQGPYPFLMVYNQPVYMSVVWFVVIVGGAYLIACGIRKIKKGRK